jgi:hypothetical protein
MLEKLDAATAEAIQFAGARGWAVVQAGRLVCLTDAGRRLVASRYAFDQALGIRLRHPSPIMAPVVTGALKCAHQSLHSSGGAVKALTRSDNLDLDDATLTTANTVDGVDAEPAADKQPGHQKLSHRIPLSEHACQGCAPLLFWVPITCCLPRNACCDRLVAAKE